jgi:hypothetical protein
MAPEGLRAQRDPVSLSHENGLFGGTRVHQGGRKERITLGKPLELMQCLRGSGNRGGSGNGGGRYVASRHLISSTGFPHAKSAVS